jgi:protein-S-isoprenylcysteine O-methyltransferase Ste14
LGAWDAGRLIEWMWISLGAYWIVSARRIKRRKLGESTLTYSWLSLPMIAAVLLLAGGEFWRGGLRAPLAPTSSLFQDSGVVLTLAGVLLAAWARYHLGANWSAVPSIRMGHELIRTGPYKHLRHPIYSGILLAALGSALVINQRRAALGFVLLWIGFALKAKREENLLGAEFGAQFEEHKQHTGFPFPRFS